MALSEDGCSPISIQQMAYGECCAERGTPTAGPGVSLGREVPHPEAGWEVPGVALEGLGADGVPVLAVAGVGFGLMSGAFSMINLLADALGPGTVGIHGDSQLYFLTSGEPTAPCARVSAPPQR